MARLIHNFPSEPHTTGSPRATIRYCGKATKLAYSDLTITWRDDVPQTRPIRRAEVLGIDVELRVIRNDGWRMSQHWHEDLQVIAGLNGEAEAIVADAAPIHLPPGALIVVPPNVPHTAYATGTAEWSFHSLHVSPSRFGAYGMGTEPIVSYRGDPLAERFAALIAGLFAKRTTTIDDLCAAFLNELSRHIGCVAMLDGQQTALQAVLRELSQDLAGASSVAQIAARHGLSAGHLSRKFHRLYGMPPHAWRMNARVEAAKQHLRSGATVARAAELSGFNDSSHLARQCKQWTGLTPRSFRRKIVSVGGEIASSSSPIGIQGMSPPR